MKLVTGSGSSSETRRRESLTSVMAGFRGSGSVITALGLHPSALPSSCRLCLRQVPSMDGTRPDVDHSHSPRFQISVNDCCFSKWQLKISRKKKKKGTDPPWSLSPGLGGGHRIDSIALNWTSDISKKAMMPVRKVHMCSSRGPISFSQQAVLLLFLHYLLYRS